MALPIVAFLLLGAAGGTAAAKGTSKIREFINEGETIITTCYNCKSGGPHTFSKIDRSWASGAVIGAVSGAIGGSVGGVTAKRIFKCRQCGREMYENGTRPTWNADKAFHTAYHYQALQTEFDTLQRVIANNKHIAQKHQERIAQLERDLMDANADRTQLRRRIEALTRILKSA